MMQRTMERTIMRRLPPLTAIEAFVQVARLGSIKAASQELALSPPALSRRVQALERFIGRPLFDRLAGATYQPPVRFFAKSGFPVRKKAGRREYVRVIAEPGGAAQRYPKDGAGILTSLTQTNALAELPEALTQLSVGDPLTCIALALLHG